MSKYKIKDLAVEISQRIENPKTSSYERFVGLEHYDSEEVMISRYGRTDNLDSSVKLFKKGDVLIARRNVYLRRAGLVDFDGVTSGDSIVIRANNKIIQRLLPFVFNTKEFWDFANQFADGSMSKRLSPKLLMDYEAELPDFDEDRIKLADLLWSVFDALTSYKDLLKRSDELVRSRFIEMFVNGGYGKTRIRNVVDTKKISAKKQYGLEDEIKYIDISSIDNSTNLIVGYTTYIFDKAPSRAQQCLKNNDVLVSTVRPNLKNVAIFLNNDEGYVGSSGFCVLRSLKCNPQYLKYVVLSDDFTNAMIGLTTGSNYPAVRDDDVLNYEMIDAPIELQNEFASFVVQIDKLKSILKENISKLGMVYKKIMNRYLKEGD